MIKSKKLAAAVAVALAAGGGMSIAATTAHAASPPAAPAVSAQPGSTFTQNNLTGIHTKPTSFYNGLCMYVASAAPGQPIKAGNCSTANQWSYYSSGQLSPEGHPEVGVGDSGGHPVLKSEPTTIVDSDAAKQGVLGTAYQLDLRASLNSPDLHLYLLVNGSGQNLSIDSSNGDNRNFWYMNAD